MTTTDEQPAPADFEARLRRDLHDAASRVVVRPVRSSLITAPADGRTSPRRRTLVLGLAVLAVTIGIGVVRVETTQRPRRRVVVATPGPATPLRMSMSSPTATLRVAANFSLPAGETGKPFGAISYRAQGALHAPLVYATLSTEPAVAVSTNPPTEAVPVGAATAYVTDAGGGLTNLIMQADATHVLRIESWGLSRQELVDAAGSVVIRSDTDFSLAKVPAGLEAHSAAPGTSKAESFAEFDLHPGTMHISVSTGDVSGRFITFLLAGSGTVQGSTQISATSVRGRPALLRTEQLTSQAAGGVQPVSFQLLWQEQSGETVTLNGGVSDTSKIQQVIAAVTPVDEATWQAMVARCPAPTGVGTDTTPHC